VTGPSPAPASLPGPGNIGDAPGARSDDVIQPEPILGRRDVAVVPWATTGAVAAGFAVSEALRDQGGDRELITVLVAVAGALFCFALTRFVDTALFVRLRTSMTVYVLGAGGLMAAISGAAYESDGARTVVLGGFVLQAMYFGLVLPRRWSLGFTALMLLCVGGVRVARPIGDFLDVGSFVMLIFAAWGFAVLCRAAHLRAERVAKRLTRCDLLTATLNRRGLIEELEAQTRRAELAQTPIALMIFDLDDFKRVNAERGTAGGDELLAWIGGTLGALLPVDASAGRLGSDEFAVAVPGVSRAEAGALAIRLQAAISDRHPVSTGVATSENGLVNAIDLVRVADAAMRVAKRDPSSEVQSLVAGGFRNQVVTGRAADPRRPIITYARLRREGGGLARPENSVIFGWLVRSAFIFVGLQGIAVVVYVLLTGVDSFYEHAVAYAGVPWVLANLAIGLSNAGPESRTGGRLTVIFVGSILLIGVGVGGAALATGRGIAAPIAAGLALKVAFDSAVGSERQARITLASMTGFWLLVAALGPAGVLWAMPLGVALLGSGYALGSISRRALEDSTAEWVVLARSDVLTGLANRTGFDEDTSAWLAAARAAASPQHLAVFAIDLSGFKQVNERSGPAAGDALLQRVAGVLSAVLSDGVAVGRLGADEFVAALPITSTEEGEAVGVAIERAVGHVLPACVGMAVFPVDGGEVEALVRAADLRCRAAKAARAAAVADARPGH
jgi:diguanylate cyclase (GGDEF)-like protein